MLWDPIRYAETCPSSDGACALVLGSESVADAAVADGNPVAWVHGHGDALASRPCRRTATRCSRSAARSARPTCTARPASPTRAADRLRRDVRAVLVVRADVAREPRLRRAGRGLEAWSRTATPQLDGDLPGQHVRRRAVVEPDRRVGHAALRRGGACRCAGQAGEHQIDGAAPGRWSRLRRRLAVLRHVGRRRRQAVMGCSTDFVTQ